MSHSKWENNTVIHPSVSPQSFLLRPLDSCPSPALPASLPGAMGMGKGIMYRDERRCSGFGTSDRSGWNH